MTLFGDYKNISRGALTREGKNATADKLIKLINDYPVVGLPVVTSLLQFKYVRKKVWSSELQNKALMILDTDLNQLSHRLLYSIPRGTDLSVYPNLNELMELVTNRSYLAQAAIPATFKSVLNRLTNNQLLYVVSNSEDIRAFLENNGITARQVRQADAHYDLSYATNKNAIEQQIKEERAKRDRNYVITESFDLVFMQGIMADMLRKDSHVQKGPIYQATRKILEAYVIEDDATIRQDFIDSQARDVAVCNKIGVKPKAFAPVTQDTIRQARSAYEGVRMKFFEKAGSTQVDGQRGQKPMGRQSVIDVSLQNKNKVNRERAGSFAGEQSIVNAISFEELAHFVCSHQAAFAYWNADPMIAAGYASSMRNRSLPICSLAEDSDHRHVTPHPNDGTVDVREVWNLIPAGFDEATPAILQIETISRYELTPSKERRGTLPRSYSLRQTRFMFKSFPGDTAFPSLSRPSIRRDTLDAIKPAT